MGIGLLRRGLLVLLAVAMLTALPVSISQAAPTAPHSLGSSLKLSGNSGGSSLKLSGPKNNRMDTSFDYTISGTATGSANYLVAWEQYYPQSGCARTYAAESTRVFLPYTYGLTLFVNKAVSHKYSSVEAFEAAHLGKHGICAYLINLASGDTVANGGAFWTNG
jgi:hypothetical protein